ncbi:MAG TPA: hypothetical protein VM537_36260 [Anaerolineae bacterium]|nr:hypothetical protein [Anaerolineae bacterium]
MNAVPFHKGDYKLLMRRIGKATGGTLYECPICKEQVLSAFGAADRHWQAHRDDPQPMDVLRLRSATALMDAVKFAKTRGILVDPENRSSRHPRRAIADYLVTEVERVAGLFFSIRGQRWSCIACGGNSTSTAADRHNAEECPIAAMQAGRLIWLQARDG